MKTKKLKRSPSQNFYEIRCESTKITKIMVVNTNSGVLGLDLHFSSPEPVNFFETQSSLGGAQFSFGGAQALISGGHGPGMPPAVAPGLSETLLRLKIIENLPTIVFRKIVSLASIITVLGLGRVSPRKVSPWPRTLGLRLYL